MNETTDDDKLAEEWTASLDAQNESNAEGYKSVPLSELEDDGSGITVESRSLDMVLDIPVTLSVEIGRTRININNLLKLNQGSVVELDRLAGEPMDVLVNGTLLAHGEIVVVNEKFGIRLTDIITPYERVNNIV